MCVCVRALLSLALTLGLPFTELLSLTFSLVSKFRFHFCLSASIRLSLSTSCPIVPYTPPYVLITSCLLTVFAVCLWLGSQLLSEPHIPVLPWIPACIHCHGNSMGSHNPSDEREAKTWHRVAWIERSSGERNVHE